MLRGLLIRPDQDEASRQRLLIWANVDRPHWSNVNLLIDHTKWKKTWFLEMSLSEVKLIYYITWSRLGLEWYICLIPTWTTSISSFNKSTCDATNLSRTHLMTNWKLAELVQCFYIVDLSWILRWDLLLPSDISNSTDSIRLHHKGDGNSPEKQRLDTGALPL